MATLKFKDIKGMSKEEKEKKLKELKMELVRARSGNAKKGSTKIKEIKKIIARIYSTNK